MTTIDDVPPFRLLLPAGWAEHPADRASVQMLIERSSDVFRAQHRPDLDVQMRTLLEIAYRKMVQGRVFAIYLQDNVAPEAILPISLTASLVSGQLGGTLDRQVARLFQEHGAEFFSDDHSVVRWEAETLGDGELAGTKSRTINYLVPVPGTGRRTAVSFTTTIPSPVDTDSEDDEFRDRLTTLSDMILSTFTWEAAS